MAVKNFKWQAHLISTRIIRLEVLDNLHDFPTIYFENFPVGQNWLTSYILTEMYGMFWGKWQTAIDF